MLSSCTTADKTSLTEAETHFQQGEYQEALTIWRKWEPHSASAALYQNIGLAESKLGNVASAIYAYEQGLRLQPGNKELRQLRVRERNRIKDATIPVESFFLAPIFSQLITLVRPGIWFLIGLLLIVIWVWQWWISIRARTIGRSLYRGWRAVIGIAGIVCCLVGVASYIYIYREDEGIIMDATPFHQAPDAGSPSFRSLFPGEKVRLLDQVGEWHQVSILNHDRGWIREKSFSLLRIPK
jgi:tetratricopeptide (TPR) repeat protein